MGEFHSKVLKTLVSVLNPDYKDDLNQLQERKIEMTLPVNKRGCQCVAYTFDQSEGMKCPFPLLSTEKGVQQMCDYVVFAVANGRLFVLMIELKNSNQQTRPQLEAGKCFAKFVIDTANRIDAFNKDNVVYRMISVCKPHFVKKGATKMRDVEYDDQGFTIFEGNTFMLQGFLK